jgi:hypothetical protein
MFRNGILNLLLDSQTDIHDQIDVLLIAITFQAQRPPEVAVATSCVRIATRPFLPTVDPTALFRGKHCCHSLPL